MEKAIIIFCLVLGVSCSGLEEKKTEEKPNVKTQNNENKKPEGFCGELSDTEKVFDVKLQEVHWMYLDDSLKNICRPLNFQLPWMESDIKIIPEMITPEILSLSPIKTFEILGQGKEAMNDSVYIFHYSLKKDYCRCDVNRYYKGNVNDKNFGGFLITEQIICNAKSAEWDFSEKNQDKNEEDSTKYEMHGHEH
jgi:hypothetical protein